MVQKVSIQRIALQTTRKHTVSRKQQLNWQTWNWEFDSLMPALMIGSRKLKSRLSWLHLRVHLSQAQALAHLHSHPAALHLAALHPHSLAHRVRVVLSHQALLVAVLPACPSHPVQAHPVKLPGYSIIRMTAQDGPVGLIVPVHHLGRLLVQVWKSDRKEHGLLAIDL